MQTYIGLVKTPADATIIFEACRQGILPRIQRRLSDRERHNIRSGSVFVWDEREAGMRRWTDGKSWSASRVAGSFLTYREMEGKRTGANADTASKDGIPGDESDDMDGIESYKYKADGLIKQSFSITTSEDQKLHLISYYGRSHPNNSSLRSPSNDPALAKIQIPRGLYPESSAHELPEPRTEPRHISQRYMASQNSISHPHHPHISQQGQGLPHPSHLYQHSPHYPVTPTHANFPNRENTQGGSAHQHTSYSTHNLPHASHQAFPQSSQHRALHSSFGSSGHSSDHHADKPRDNGYHEHRYTPYSSSPSGFPSSNPSHSHSTPLSMSSGHNASSPFSFSNPSTEQQHKAFSPRSSSISHTSPFSHSHNGPIPFEHRSRREREHPLSHLHEPEKLDSILNSRRSSLGIKHITSRSIHNNEPEPPQPGQNISLPNLHMPPGGDLPGRPLARDIPTDKLGRWQEETRALDRLRGSLRL